MGGAPLTTKTKPGFPEWCQAPTGEETSLDQSRATCWPRCEFLRGLVLGFVPHPELLLCFAGPTFLCEAAGCRKQEPSLQRSVLSADHVHVWRCTATCTLLWLLSVIVEVQSGLHHRDTGDVIYVLFVKQLMNAKL